MPANIAKKDGILFPKLSTEGGEDLRLEVCFKKNIILFAFQVRET
jgi:hypothetical protein